MAGGRSTWRGNQMGRGEDRFVTHLEERSECRQNKLKWRRSTRQTGRTEQPFWHRSAWPSPQCEQLDACLLGLKLVNWDLKCTRMEKLTSLPQEGNTSTGRGLFSKILVFRNRFPSISFQDLRSAVLGLQWTVKRTLWRK